MAVEVIGAGFGRTGTMSLKVALEELGFAPCYHMTEVFEHSEHIDLWKTAAHGKPVDWDEIFHEYHATVDWPSAAFYKELMEEYPDAKVILTVRDPDRWYESTRTTIYGMSAAASSPVFSLAGVFVPRLRRIRRAVLMVSGLAWEEMFSGRFEDREYAIQVFKRWNEGVKERVPANRLLVYEVKDGWGPLCEFLGVDVPDKPFPHLNDAEVFRERIRRIRALTVVMLAFGVSLAGLVMLRFRQRR
jgi:Sulfotransferase domain